MEVQVVKGLTLPARLPFPETFSSLLCWQIKGNYTLQTRSLPVSLLGELLRTSG